MNRRSFVRSMMGSAVVVGSKSEEQNVSRASSRVEGRSTGEPPGIKLASPFLEVALDPAMGTWTCATTSGGLLFDRATAAVASSATFLELIDAQVPKKASQHRFQDALGSGVQGVLSVTDRNSGLHFEVAIKLYDQFAGLSLSCRIENRNVRAIRLESISPLKAHLETPNSHAGATRILLNGFNSWDYTHVQPVQSAGAGPSFDNFAITAPKMVAGFLSANAAYGTFEYRVLASQIPILQASAEFNIVLPSGKVREADALLILFPSDLLGGLEAYASAVEKWNHLHPKRSASTTWCSWYSGYGRAKQANLDALEDATIENAELMAPLVPLGANTLRVVDDSNDERYGDWNFPFVPHGMKNLADKLHGMGRKPGVWLAPAFVSESSHVFKEHPDWLQRYSDGTFVTRRNFYGNTMHFFDASHPAVLAYLRELFLRIRGRGFEYVMIDFLYMFGLSDHYYNPHRTRAEIYRQAVSTIREALGPEVYLLGCGAPQLASAGLVDGMRIGPDAWGEVGYENVAARYFEAGKWWLNDPDALVGNDRPVEGYRAWVTLAALSGSVLTIGDDLAMLARDKLEILKKILPAQGRVGKPLDLFASNPSNLWSLETDISEGKSVVLGLFNWKGNGDLVHRINPGEILKIAQPVLIYDFWNDYFLEESRGLMEVSVAPGHVRAVCLAERTGVPQVLATSNFLPQNDWALNGVRWSESTNTLEGQGTGDAGTPFHIAFYAPAGYHPVAGQSEGRAAFLVKQQKNVWVIPMIGTGQTSKWSVAFRRTSEA